MSEPMKDETRKRLEAMLAPHRHDFNSMTDDEIAAETEIEIQKRDEAEEWIEAVSAWEALGKPRDKEEDDA